MSITQIISVNMTSCHLTMKYQLRIISFLVIIYSFNCNISTVYNDNVKSGKELMVKYNTTQTMQKQSQTSNRNISKELSLAQSIQDLNQPSVILRVYTGSVTKLLCKLNPTQIGKNTIMWFYSATNLSFNPLQEDETIVNKWNLTIYNTKLQHAGVYRCASDKHHDAVVLLEVVDDEIYNVVKPLSSRGPYASKPVALNSQLVMLSSWSEWSECSRCELVGRKRRYGVCYITLIDKSQSAKTKQNVSIDEGTLKLFHTFPGGIPCRSQILPLPIRNISIIQTYKNEIMIGLCKVKCKESIFEIRSKSGKIIETVNNTAGIYSLSQNKPPQPPLPTRTIMYVEPGKRVLIKCFGTTLRDIPFTWRVDTQEISPRDLDRLSDGRVHLNARDHIVFTFVLYSDSHVYSFGELFGCYMLRLTSKLFPNLKNIFFIPILCTRQVLFVGTINRLITYKYVQVVGKTIFWRVWSSCEYSAARRARTEHGSLYL